MEHISFNYILHLVSLNRRIQLYNQTVLFFNMTSKWFADVFTKIQKFAKKDSLPTAYENPYVSKGNGINSSIFAVMNTKVALSLVWLLSSVLCIYLSYYHCRNYSSNTTVKCQVSECSVLFRPDNGRSFVFDVKDIVGADSVRIDESLGGNLICLSSYLLFIVRNFLFDRSHYLN